MVVTLVTETHILFKSDLVLCRKDVIVRHNINQGKNKCKIYSPPPLTLPAAVLLVLLALALPVRAACPDGFSVKSGNYLSVTDVKASGNGKTQASLHGLGNSTISPRDIEGLSEVTGQWPRDFSHAELAITVRDQNGALVHGGFWLYMGTVGWQGGTRDLTLGGPPWIFHNLEPATKHVAQIIVSRLRHVSGGLGNRDVTNEFVSGDGHPISGHKPKPVFAQVCFQTPAIGS